MITEKQEKLLENIDELLTKKNGLTMDIKECLFNLKQNIAVGRDIIRFKTVPGHNLKEEYEKCDNRLSFVFDSYALAVYRKFGYKPTITTVNRTHPKEQDNIYLNHYDPDVVQAYKEKPWISTHSTDPCRALDFRTNDMTFEIAKFTDDYFKQVVYTGPRNTLIRHSVKGDHNHMQIDSDNFTSIRRI